MPLSETLSLVDPTLQNMAPGLFELQLDSRASSTVKKYTIVWSTWHAWILAKMGIPVIPAKPLHVALFTTKLYQTAVQKGTGISSIEAIIHSIKWGHSLAGLVECPTNHPLVKSTLKPKQPLPINVVQKVAEYYGTTICLALIRLIFILLVGYTGLFCMNKIQSIALKDIVIHNE